VKPVSLTRHESRITKCLFHMKFPWKQLTYRIRFIAHGFGEIWIHCRFHVCHSQ